jgi:predicted small lipoprotein YifL
LGSHARDSMMRRARRVPVAACGRCGELCFPPKKLFLEVAGVGWQDAESYRWFVESCG